ncbi:MAG: carboxylating nicotinate-nucleotide diphosphorylase [Bacillota bacterium]
MLQRFLVEDIIKRALQEDLAWGDVTTEATVDPDLLGTAYIYAKQEGVVAGLQVAAWTFQMLEPRVLVDFLCRDGELVTYGQRLLKIEGPVRAILSAERVALNLLQRMSGIATQTRRLVEALAGYKIKLVDTRKTTPGLRILEKYAVRVGGGANHRFGLADCVLIKDNHIKAAGGIKAAVNKARQRVGHTMKIEVEVENLTQVQEALQAGADIIMLDNMNINTITEAVALAKGKAILEVSGGMDLEKARQAAELGIDLVSVGSLTHSVKAMDISLDLFTSKISTFTAGEED